MSGIESGLRYTRHSPPMRALIVHNVSFALCASAVLALLPVIARDQLELGAGGFGLLSASFGIGAVVSALLIPRGLQPHVAQRGGHVVRPAVDRRRAAHRLGRLHGGRAPRGVRHRRRLDRRPLEPVRRNADVGAGVGAGPRGRDESHRRAGEHGAGQRALGLARVARRHARSRSPRRPARMLVLLAVNRRVRVRMGDEADVTPSMQLPDLAIAFEPQPDDGPVLIQIEYRIDAEQRRALHERHPRVEAIRRRNGASDWRVFRDLGEDGRFVERFIIRSWAEYVRLRTRMTMADREIQDRVEGLQRPDVPVRVSRLIAT